MFEVIKGGLSTSIQDLGRPGFFHLGIPISGAMDRYALRVANLLVGNEETAAGLEAVFMGPELRFEKESSVAVTGANIPVFVDGEPKDTWTSFTVKKGQILNFGVIKSGARIYIGISGGISTPKSLDSRSTYPIGSLGGINGRNIEECDQIPTGDSLLKRSGLSLPSSMKTFVSKKVTLRMIKGLYWHRLTEDSGTKFLSEEWRVAPEADRMGYRFRGGSPLKFVERAQPFGAGSDPSNIVDGCYSYGSLQVPGGTEPIILHRDAVSGGGYFTLGAIISADMDIIGQLQPHTPVQFSAVEMPDALKARKLRQEKLERVRKFVS